ncbi:MAG: DUF6465 family protein [Lachnospiraceae bacterium]|nr:DUF6465 family protein [Lachnospiraceae bacterium]
MQAKKTTGNVKTKTVKKEAAPVKKTAAKKTAAVKTAAAKKTEAKKTGRKRSVASTISLSKKINYVLQCKANPEGISYSQLVATTKDIWRTRLGKKAGDIKEIELYIKPEEGKVYFVINKDTRGDFDL